MGHHSISFIRRKNGRSSLLTVRCKDWCQQYRYFWLVKPSNKEKINGFCEMPFSVNRDISSIFLILGMGKKESVKEFYEHRGQGQSIPDAVKARQFNVFERNNYSNNQMSYNRRDFYKISLVTGGSGNMHYAARGVLVDKPALIFSNPLVPYSWEALTEQQDGFFCLFTEDFLNESNRNESLQNSPLFKTGSNPVFFVDDTQLIFLSNVYNKMLSETDTDYIYKYDLMRNYVNLLIHEALKMQPNTTYFKHPNAASRIASLFMELLERQFPIDAPRHSLKLRTASDYAESLSVHVNHLNHAVREITGKPTTAHITEKIINEAKALLKHTDWSVSEIAYSLGFEYPTYFNNFFKKKTGLTPKLLRQ